MNWKIYPRNSKNAIGRNCRGGWWRQSYMIKVFYIPTDAQ